MRPGPINRFFLAPDLAPSITAGRVAPPPAVRTGRATGWRASTTLASLDPGGSFPKYTLTPAASGWIRQAQLQGAWELLKALGWDAGGGGKLGSFGGRH